MQLDSAVPPKMFHALRQWALGLREVGDLPSAASAAESLCREARTPEEIVESCRMLGELRRALGDLDGARPAFERLVEIAREITRTTPGLQAQYQLLAALDDLGDLARQQGDHWTVLECYGNHGRVGILRELGRTDGPQVHLLTEQCYSLRRAGNAARGLGSIEEALSLFDERLAVARITSAGDPGDPQLVALVAGALADLGSLLAGVGDRRATLLLREELGLRTWLQARRPYDAETRQDLATCHMVMSQAGMSGAGVDTSEHKRIATTLLAQLEQEGSLDDTGKLLLGRLRAG